MAVFGPRRRVVVIPAATITRVAARLETHGRIPRGYLGLSLKPVAVDGGGGPGAMVVAVDAKGPGATAGIHQGDVLVRWDGSPLGGIRRLLRALGADSVGTPGRPRAAARRTDPTGRAHHRRKARRLKELTAREPLRLAIDVADPALADRLASVLARAEGIELVAAGQDADAVVVMGDGAGQAAGVEVPLTARELEVLALLAEGASNKLIARRLGISTHTAKFHVASLIEKLDAVSRTDAVAHAARLGVIHL